VHPRQYVTKLQGLIKWGKNKDILNHRLVIQNHIRHNRRINMTTIVKSLAQPQAFYAQLEIEQVLLPVDDIRQITEQQLDQFVSIFNRYGFLIIQHAPTDSPEEQLVALGKWLGTANVHDRSNEKGIVSISPDKNLKGYLGASTDKHPLHTDGAYDALPPKFLCLQCIQHAESGGDSIIVSAKAAYNWLKDKYPESLEALFAPDVLTVKRLGREGTRAVFRNENGNISVVWRDDFTTTFAPRPEVTRAIELFRSFVSDPANRLTFKLMPNQIIVGDNLRILHGRTSFDSREKRKLIRMNNNGDSEFCQRLTFGFPKV
jgi:alpha-ketoglutarate-dependent taurine dioxygenase